MAYSSTLALGQPRKRRKFDIVMDERPVALGMAVYVLASSSVDNLKGSQAYLVLGVSLQEQTSSWHTYSSMLVNEAHGFRKASKKDCGVGKGAIQTTHNHVSDLVRSLAQCSSPETLQRCIAAIEVNLTSLFTTPQRPKEPFEISKGRVDELRYHIVVARQRACKLHVCRDSLAAMDTLLDRIYREEKRASFLVRCAFKRIKLIGRLREFLERRSKLQALWRHRRKHATWALQKIPGLHSQLQALKTETESLRRRLSRYEDPVVDLTGSDDAVEARPDDNQLLAAHARATNERLVAVKREVVDERARADDQGTNAMYLTAQKSELQSLVSEAARALIDADVPTHECPDNETPFYYMLESHRDDGKQTVPWNPEAGRAMTLAEGIAWLRNNPSAKRRRRH